MKGKNKDQIFVKFGFSLTTFPGVQSKGFFRMLLARIMITKLHAILPFTSLNNLKVCTLNLKLNGKVIKSLLIVSLRYCIR